METVVDRLWHLYVYHVRSTKFAEKINYKDMLEYVRTPDRTFNWISNNNGKIFCKCVPDFAKVNWSLWWPLEYVAILILRILWKIWIIKLFNASLLLHIIYFLIINLISAWQASTEKPINISWFDYGNWTLYMNMRS